MTVKQEKSWELLPYTKTTKRRKRKCADLESCCIDIYTKPPKMNKTNIPPTPKAWRVMIKDYNTYALLF